MPHWLLCQTCTFFPLLAAGLLSLLGSCCSPGCSKVAQEVIVFPPALAKAPHCQRQILRAFQVGAFSLGQEQSLGNTEGFQAFISGQLLLVIPTAPSPGCTVQT